MMMNPGAKEAHQSGDMPKESANGRVARWLAGDEWMAVLTSARGKKTVKGKIFLAIAPFYRRRRERERVWLGPLGWRWTSTSNRTSEAHGTRRCPLFQVTDRWAAVIVFKHGTSRFG
jgi:hypothetical protein